MRARAALPIGTKQRARGTAVACLALLVVAAAIAGCSESPTEVQTPATLEIVSGDAQSGVVGQTLSAELVVQVTDEDGDRVRGVSVTWQVAQGDGSVAAVQERTDAAGKASASWTLGTSAGTHTASARVAGGLSVTFSATATAAPADRLELVQGDQQRALAGTELADSLIIIVTDEYSNPVSGVIVDWTVTEGGGSISPETSTTDSDGLAGTSWTLGPVAGTNSVIADATELATVNFVATADAMSSDYVSGTITLPEGSTISEAELRVVSFAGAASVQSDGSFAVGAAKGQSQQLMFVTSEATNEPVLIAIHDPVSGSVMAGDTSTALALTLLNPYLILTNRDQRAEYLAAVRNQPAFSELIAVLGQAYRADATQALDYEENTRAYQLAVQLMRAAMEQLGGVASLHGSRVEAAAGLAAPYIEDVPAHVNIEFVNPRHVYYGGGINENGTQLREVITVKRTETLLSFNFGWPPITQTEPEITEYGLGDGYFRVDLAKGLDFTKFLDWNTDPAGRATVLNTGQGVIYVLELLVGSLPLPDVHRLPDLLHPDRELLAEMARHAAQLAVEKFMTDFMRLLSENAEDVAYWVWQEYETNAAHQFISIAGNLMGRVTLVLELLGYVNEEGPFFWDLVFAPGEVTYYVTQDAGTIISMDQNDAPAPAFTVSPPAGIVGTEFHFDASATSDDHDVLGTVFFRWDWESDGTWDTDWRADPQASHTFADAGAYSVALEALDSQGLTAVVSHLVVVGGGAGTATHVKLVRGNLPWDSHAQELVLQSLGFVQGTGPGTYEVVGLEEIPTVPLRPGEDLIIISNDQSQAFYNTYAAYQVRFTNFVHDGGSMLWEACDEGWAYGSMAEAGIVLPGNVSVLLDIDVWNYVVDPNMPLVSGLPVEMDHNYASHESFSDLLDGTVIYMVNESDDPTLIEYNLGDGWMIVTGQPLEHQYDLVYGNPDMENLLPRIVAYFTGADAGAAAQLAEAIATSQKPARAGRPSHEPKR